MDRDQFIETVRRLRKYGFQLRVAHSISTGSHLELQLYALPAAAAVLFDVGPEAFPDEGNWVPVDLYVRESGLVKLSQKEGKRLGLNPLGVAGANPAMDLARHLLEHAISINS